MPYFFNEYDLTKNANREEPERLRKQVIFILMITPKGREILKEYLNETVFCLENKEERHVKKFLKSLF
ncbi:hypothetical protein BTM205_04980 [Helicobacter pylori]